MKMAGKKWYKMASVFFNGKNLKNPSAGVLINSLGVGSSFSSRLRWGGGWERQPYIDAAPP